MIDPWLKLIQFLTTSFGLPGACAVAIAGYLMWLLKIERAAHDATRDKIDSINEKRIESTVSTIQTIDKLQTSLDAVTAILGKIKS
jgi:hypothetical protein